MTSVPTAENSVVAHYDEKYLAWQAGAVAGTTALEVQKFTPWIKPGDRVLDFGCGTGAILQAIACASKVGVEINPHARALVAQGGIEAVASLDDVADASIDVMISNHALEHVPAPLAVLGDALAKLKPGGTAVFVVPCERYDTAYRPDNIDQHLYTWSPVNLGNLFHHAGFEVVECARFAHRWPPRVHKLLPILGLHVCNVLCRITARLRPKLTQVRIVARRPLAG